MLFRSYVVPEGQYITRFYFVSGTGTNTQGNLLDDVYFSTEFPEPIGGKGTIIIKKEVEGIDSGKMIPKDSFEFQIKKVDNGKEELIETVKLPTDLGAMVYVNAGLEPGDYKICEVNQEDKLSDLELDGDTYCYVSTSTGINNSLKSGFESDVKIRAFQRTEVTFKNTYESSEAKYKRLKVTKQVEGNGGDKNQEFEFEFTIKDQNDKLVESLDSIKIYKEDAEISVTDNKFILKHGESAEIRGIPVNYTVSVNELGAEDYHTTINRNNGNQPLRSVNGVSSKNGENAAIVGKAFELEMFEDSEVVFTNTKNIAAPTGVHTNRFPHLLMMAMAALSMAGMAFTSVCAKAHKKDED